jgi:alpha-tubulin suppressor-like RCC1 family protein
MKKPGKVGPLKDKRVSMVACGGPYTVLATDDEEVWAFGANARGQLGLGEQSEESMQPKMLPPPKGMLSWKVELIACGYAHTVFLTDNLCVSESPRAPAPLPGSTRPGKPALSPARLTAPRFVTPRRSVFSCGANSWGQLGLGHTDDRNEPCLVEMLRNVRVQQLDCGAAHTMVVCDAKRSDAKRSKRGDAIDAPPIEDMDVDDGEPRSPDAPEDAPDEPHIPNGPGVYGFGRNKEGQLGLAGPSHMSVNDQIQKQPQKLTELDEYLEDKAGIELRCGGYHTAVLVENREKLLTFGQNCFGQLGLGHMDDRYSPEEVQLPPGVTGSIKMLACGGGHTVVVTESRQVLAFGRNNRGQLGVGDMEHKAHPAVVAELCDKNIVQVECGSKHTMVLTRSDDTDQPELYAIGRNTEGQLGMGDVEHEPAPKRVPDSETFLSCAGGHGHLSVGGFSAHNFFVPVPQLSMRRNRMIELLKAQKLAVAMGGHGRLGHASLMCLLSSDLVQYIGSLLTQRRSGAALTEGEAMIERSPSVSRIIEELRI